MHYVCKLLLHVHHAVLRPAGLSADWLSRHQVSGLIPCNCVTDIYPLLQTFFLAFPARMSAQANKGRQDSSPGCQRVCWLGLTAAYGHAGLPDALLCCL